MVTCQCTDFEQSLLLIFFTILNHVSDNTYTLHLVVMSFLNSLLIPSSSVFLFVIHQVFLLECFSQPEFCWLCSCYRIQYIPPFSLFPVNWYLDLEAWSDTSLIFCYCWIVLFWQYCCSGWWCVFPSGGTYCQVVFLHHCCSVAKLCPAVCDPVDCSTPGFPVLHCLPIFTVLRFMFIESVMPSNHLTPFSCPRSCQHQGLFQ